MFGFQSSEVSMSVPTDLSGKNILIGAHGPDSRKLPRASLAVIVFSSTLEIRRTDDVPIQVKLRTDKTTDTWRYGLVVPQKTIELDHNGDPAFCTLPEDLLMPDDSLVMNHFAGLVGSIASQKLAEIEL